MKISIGDRVRSLSSDFQGEVIGVTLEITPMGYVPFLRVRVESAVNTKGGEIESPAVEWASTTSVAPNPKPCPGCGKVHEKKEPFSAQVQTLVERFRLSEDEDEKEALLVSIGHECAKNVDATDVRVPMWLHNLVEHAYVTSEAADRAWVALGRAIVAAMLSEQAQMAVPAILGSRLASISRVSNKPPAGKPGDGSLN
jgi:hypothetical protein